MLRTLMDWPGIQIIKNHDLDFEKDLEFTWTILTRLISLVLFSSSGGNTSTANASAMMATIRVRLLLLLPEERASLKLLKLKDVLL